MHAVFPFVAKEAKIEFFDSRKKTVDACREVVAARRAGGSKMLVS